MMSPSTRALRMSITSMAKIYLVEISLGRKTVVGPRKRTLRQRVLVMSEGVTWFHTKSS